MIHLEKFSLSNGLRVVVHEDHSTPMAIVNVLYDAGSKDEDPGKTGFAHLFEHLMFVNMILSYILIFDSLCLLGVALHLFIYGN